MDEYICSQTYTHSCINSLSIIFGLLITNTQIAKTHTTFFLTSCYGDATVFWVVTDQTNSDSFCNISVHLNLVIVLNMSEP